MPVSDLYAGHWSLTGCNVPDGSTADEAVEIFHAGTKAGQDGAVVANGGRVLGVTAMGDSISTAKLQAYKGVKEIRWKGAWCRKDISDKALLVKS